MALGCALAGVAVASVTRLAGVGGAGGLSTVRRPGGSPSARHSVAPAAPAAPLRGGAARTAGASAVAGATAAALGGGAALAVGAAAASRAARTRAAAVGKPLVQVSERVASIAHMLGISPEESEEGAPRRRGGTARPLGWLRVLDQLARIEARVDELRVVVEEASAADGGVDSAALAAAVADGRAALAAAEAAEARGLGAPEGAPRSPARGRFAAWPVPWSQAGPLLREGAGAELASVQEAQLLRVLAEGDDLAMRRFSIWAVAAPSGETRPGFYLAQPRPPQALVFATTPTRGEASFADASEYAIPEERVVVHHVAVLPGEAAREPIKVALRDWVESLAPKAVVFPDPASLQ
ncbi:unnamed protein product, partial [Prorocentrum cordatum]